jgi:hypothetical protein
MVEDEPKPVDTLVTENKIAARSALLDFYGDYSVSFSSQFVASIFGLAAASALINTALFNLLTTQTFSSVSLVLFVIISLFIFLGFLFAAYHTYTRFRFYAALASSIAGFPTCLRGEAKLHEIFAESTFETREKGLMKINAAFSKLKKECKVPEDIKPFRKDRKKGDKHAFEVIFPVYEELETQKQNEKPLKQILSSKWFPLIWIVGIFLLSLITYYPFIEKLVYSLL